MAGVSAESPSWGGVEICGCNDHQPDAVCGNEPVSTGVVEGSLGAAVDSADGQAIGFVEVGDRLVVLPFAVLDHQVGSRPVAVDGQSDAPAGLPGIAEEPLELMLTLATLSQHPVAEVEDVGLVAGVSSHSQVL